MNWLENPTKLAAAELQLCKLKLFKAEAGKAWAETMIEYNTRRIEELGRYLDTQPEIEVTPTFQTLQEAVAQFTETLRSVTIPGFKIASPAPAETGEKL